MVPYIVNSDPHVASVSIRNQLTDMQRRQEMRVDFHTAHKEGVGIVELTPGLRVPAAIGFRTIVTDQTLELKQVKDHWRVTLAPFEESLLRRFFAERAQPQAVGDLRGALDVPIPQMKSASYDAVAELKKAHKGFSELRPRNRTIIEATFAIRRNLSTLLTHRASSTEALRKLCERLTIQNHRLRQMWEALAFPLKAPLRVSGITLWPLPFLRVPEPEYSEIPEVPDCDPWEHGGDVYEKVGDILSEQFEPIFRSLWKAAFVQDGQDGREGRCARQLREQGYELDKLESTRMGFGPLRELMKKHRHHGNLTQMGDLESLEELGPEHISRLTKHGM